MSLQTYKDLGVKELSVNNHEAVPVNPYEKWKFSSDWNKSIEWNNFEIIHLPPLPTSGIADGTVSIEEVEEQLQGFYYDKFWYPVTQSQYDLCPDNCRRTALVRKQGKEEDLSNYSIDYNQIKQEVTRPNQAQEQTAEGIEHDASRELWYKKGYKHGWDDREFQDSTLVNLAQYKEKLIKELEAMEYSHDNTETEHGMYLGIDKAINLIRKDKTKES